MPAVAAAIVGTAAFAVPAVAGTSVAGGPDGWHNAIVVPGTSGLNTGKTAQTWAVSCPAAGECVAGGDYTVGSGEQSHERAFVVSEVKGVWQKAVAIPVPAAAGGNAAVAAVACTSPGNCLISIFTAPEGLVTGAMMDSEVNGVWGKAVPVPGAAKLGSPNPMVTSCGARGDCTIGGTYGGLVKSGLFVADEVNGVWKNAVPVPGTKVTTGDIMTGISCPSAGNCAASGQDNGTAFVVNEVHGMWGTATHLPGPGGGKTTEAMSVSCSAPGDCGTSGSYTTTANGSRAFVANEVNGVWGKPIQVPGTSAANGIAGADSISCPARGTCTVAGEYGTSDVAPQFPIVASEVKGVWQQAQVIPGTRVFGAAQESTSISCPASGNCSVLGLYQNADGTRSFTFIDDQVNGVWHTAFAAPGLSSLPGSYQNAVTVLSCGTLGNCAGGGDYQTQSGSSQAVVISRS